MLRNIHKSGAPGGPQASPGTLCPPDAQLMCVEWLWNPGLPFGGHIAIPASEFWGCPVCVYAALHEASPRPDLGGLPISITGHGGLGVPRRSQIPGPSQCRGHVGALAPCSAQVRSVWQRHHHHHSYNNRSLGDRLARLPTPVQPWEGEPKATHAPCIRSADPNPL